MKTFNKNTELDRQIKAYILECLNGYEADLTSEDAIWSYIRDRFNSEYDFMIKRHGHTEAMYEWLLGLALPVEFTYFDIEKLLKKWGVLTGGESNDKLIEELDNYWTRLAHVIVSNYDNEV